MDLYVCGKCCSKYLRICTELDHWLPVACLEISRQGAFANIAHSGKEGQEKRASCIMKYCLSTVIAWLGNTLATSGSISNRECQDKTGKKQDEDLWQNYRKLMTIKGEVKMNHSARLRKPTRKCPWGYAGYKPGELKKNQNKPTTKQTQQ